MLEARQLPVERTPVAEPKTGTSGIERELQSQLRLPARSNAACTINEACSSFKPDYKRETESGRAWDGLARRQRQTGIEPGADGKYEVKPGDSLWGIAERMIKKEGGRSTPAELQKRVKELVEANKENIPGLDCNPNLLRRGARLILPDGPVQPKPGEKPGDKPAEKPAEKPADKPAEQPGASTDVKPGDRSTERPAEKPVDRPADKPAERPTDKPADKPAENSNTPDRLPAAPADRCKPVDIYQDLASHKDLTAPEFLTASRIVRSVMDGDMDALKKATADLNLNKESGERIARALNETFKDQGIVTSYRELNYGRSSNGSENIVGSFSIYRRGADKYLEVGKDYLGLAGPVQIEPGGPINYGNVSYPSLNMQEASIEDLARAMKRRYCPS